MKYIYSDSTQALDYMKKYSVFLTGPPGTGKSYTTKSFINWCNSNYIRISITASTGIAANNINGTTLHSWAGIGLGQETKEKLLELVKSKKYKQKKWLTTDILIIDEISMISSELWLKLDYIGRNIRKIDKPFGGIRIIAVGDFYQLPPVKGSMLFEEIDFNSYFDYGIALTKNYRSKDDNLTNILYSIRSGIKLNDEQNSLLKSKVNKNNIRYPILVSLRDTAREMNKNNLKELETDKYKYLYNISCVDKKTGNIIEDNTEFYNSFKNIAFSDSGLEKKLILKIGAPVINLINDPNTGLVNGSVGTVIEFRNGNPFVKFNNFSIEIQKYKYIKEFDNVNIIIEQYPLLLAYALTIHRAQGQTLSQGTILLDKTIWEDGQAYVALSRLQTLDSLTLLKYNKNVFKVSSKVKKFYENFL